MAHPLADRLRPSARPRDDEREQDHIPDDPDSEVDGAPMDAATMDALREPAWFEPRKDVEAADPGTLAAWLARLGVLLVAIVLFRLGFEMWWVGRIHENIWVQFLVAAYYVGGLSFLTLALREGHHVRYDYVGFFFLIQALAYYSVIIISVVNVNYTSDALLFVHQAAVGFIQGNNPYEMDLVGGYEAFTVPYYIQTPTTTGGIITNLNYPALSFLIYSPFVLMGLTDLRVVSMLWLISLLGFFFLIVPRHLRLITVSILFLSSFFLAFSISGFDIVFVFFLVATMATIQRRPRLGMVFFGLSAAIKQTVWFIAPFLIAILWKESRGEPFADRAKGVAIPGGLMLLSFLIPNLPFLIWNPVAWYQGVFTAVGAGGEQLVPLSQGLTIFIYTGALVIDLFLLHLLAGTVWVTLFVAYWFKYDRLRHIAWIVPPIVLAFTERTLQNYYEMFYPVALLILIFYYPRWIAVHGDREIDGDRFDDDPERARATFGEYLRWRRRQQRGRRVGRAGGAGGAGGGTDGDPSRSARARGPSGAHRQTHAPPATAYPYGLENAPAPHPGPYDWPDPPDPEEMWDQSVHRGPQPDEGLNRDAHGWYFESRTPSHDGEEERRDQAGRRRKRT